MGWKPDYRTARDLDVPAGISDCNTMMNIPKGTDVRLLFWLTDRGATVAAMVEVGEDFGPQVRIFPDDIEPKEPTP